MYKIQFRSEAVTAAIARLKAALGDMEPAFQSIGETLVASTKQRFNEGKGPDGAAWAPKRQATLDAYEARGDGRPSRPLIGPSKRLSSEIHYGASRGGVVVGSNLIYALTQQLGVAKGAFGATARGAPIPWGAIPARPFLGLSEGDEANIVAELTEHLERAAGSGG